MCLAISYGQRAKGDKKCVVVQWNSQDKLNQVFVGCLFLWLLVGFFLDEILANFFSILFL